MNLKPYFFALAPLWLGLFLPLAASAQSNSFFPLEQGLHHAYTSHMDGSPDKFVTVTGRGKLDGRDVWVVQWNYPASPDYRIEFYSIAPDGDVLFHGTRGRNSLDDIVEYVATPPFRILDMPLSEGHTWTDPYAVDYYLNFSFEYTMPGYSYEGEIIGNGFPMTVPAGSFTALVVAGVTLVGGSDLTQRMDYYFAMDVGILRRDSRIDGQQGEITELLWSMPLGEQTRSWGDLKALFR
jgi:hypothetical protein